MLPTSTKQGEKFTYVSFSRTHRFIYIYIKYGEAGAFDIQHHRRKKEEKED